MTNKKKGILIGVICLSAATIIAASSLALFTAETNADTAAKVGTVDITMSDVVFTNADNVNPGDNDPRVTENANAGTDHKVIYSVSNLGTKSVKTRQTIVLTCDVAGSSTQVLDARYLALFKDGNELVEKTYIMNDGTEIKDTAECDAKAEEIINSADYIMAPAVAKDGTFIKQGGGTEYYDENREHLDLPYIKAVKYVFISDSYDGFGKDVKDGGNAEKEHLDTVVAAATEAEDAPVVKEYTYDFSLLKEANNLYQGADIKVEIMVEAMQFRNTQDEDWKTISTVERVFSAAQLDVDTVPNEDEDKDGNKITVNRGGTDKSNEAVADAKDKYNAADNKE